MSEEKIILGPAMSALNEQQRTFVDLLMSQNKLDYTEAYRQAYPGDTSERPTGNASRLAHSPKIQAALKEESIRRLGAAPQVAISQLIRIAQDSTSKKQFEACVAILNRCGITEFAAEQTVVHKHQLPYKEMLLELRDIAIRLGMPLPPGIEDAEFTEVPKDPAPLSLPAPDQTGLEDIL